MILVERRVPFLTVQTSSVSIRRLFRANFLEVEARNLSHNVVGSWFR